MVLHSSLLCLSSKANPPVGELEERSPLKEDQPMPYTEHQARRQERIEGFVSQPVGEQQMCRFLLESIAGSPHV